MHRYHGAHPSARELASILGFVLALGFASAQAQIPGSTSESQLMLAKSVKLPTTTMYYRLFVPKNYDASRKYPLVVCLHGVGERGADNKAQVDREDLAHPWIEDSIQARVPHFIMIPQCPADSIWGGMNGQGMTSLTGAEQGILDAIDSLRGQYHLDADRFYLIGLSLGGAGTYSLLRLKPGFFAAAAPCAASLDTTGASGLAQIPFWSFHGSLDSVTHKGNWDKIFAGALERKGVKVVRFTSQAAITSPSLSSYRDALKNGTPAVDLVAKNPTLPVTWDSLTRAVAGGADHLYSELTGGDHRSGWMIAFHHPLLARWMFSKSRSPVALARATLLMSRGKNRATWITGGLPRALDDGKVYSLLGRSVGTPRLTLGPGARSLVLSDDPAR